MPIEIRNPANPGEIVGTYPTITPEDVPRLVQTAEDAQRDWGPDTPARTRPHRRCFLNGLEARGEDIARSITRKMGKIIAESRGEVARSCTLSWHFSCCRQAENTFFACRL